MNNLGTQPLQTERLLLRRFRPEDAQAMFDNWASDPEVTKFLTWPPYQSVEDVRRYLTNLAGEYRKEDRYTWAIVLRELGQPVGSISVAHQDLRVNSVEVGYCVGRAWWGQGIMTEAFSAVLDFLFDRVGVNRVTAQHDPENPASGRVMAKCGLRKEGVLRQSARCNLGVRDVACWGILRSDRPGGNYIV
ncbi:MAG: GNAT family N-acetyltransferase [Clostridiales bacterium]|nr:GNAT family N-acetyltransferase [Clostridiales bacterium]